MKHHVVNFYRDLYTVDYSVSGVFPCRGKFPLLQSEEKGDLLLMVSDDEVRRAVFCMSSLKTLGWMGFRRGFFNLNGILLGLWSVR